MKKKTLLLIIFGIVLFSALAFQRLSSTRNKNGNIFVNQPRQYEKLPPMLDTTTWKT